VFHIVNESNESLISKLGAELGHVIDGLRAAKIFAFVAINSVRELIHRLEAFLVAEVVWHLVLLEPSELLKLILDTLEKVIYSLELLRAELLGAVHHFEAIFVLFVIELTDMELEARPEGTRVDDVLVLSGSVEVVKDMPVLEQSSSDLFL